MHIKAIEYGVATSAGNEPGMRACAGEISETGPGFRTEGRDAGAIVFWKDTLRGLCMKLKIAICDDDAAQAAALSEEVSAWAGGKMQAVEIRTYASGEAFLCDYDGEKDFNLLLLDIEMKGISGIDLAKNLRRDNSRAEILFLTSHTEFYGEGYEVDALHYLIKPVDRGKLYTVLDRALEKLSVEPPFLIVRSEGQTVKLYESEIYYVEAFLHYVTFVTQDADYSVREKISELEKRLSEGFYRAHRSFLVSLEHIRRIARDGILMENGATVPLARGKYDDINREYIRFYSTPSSASRGGREGQRAEAAGEGGREGQPMEAAGEKDRVSLPDIVGSQIN